MTIETTTEVSSTDGGLAPVASGERIEDPDVLRGFALFGVLVVNGMTWFRTTPARLRLTPDHWPGFWNLIIEKVQTALFDQKFITLFSFLFGVGMAINAERAEARGGRPIRFLLRRFFFLVLLGAAHVLLLWFGDILYTYALLGALSLIVIRCKSKTIAITAGVIAALPFIGNTIRVIVKLVKHETAVQTLKSAVDQAPMIDAMEESIRIHAHGTWLEIARRRLVEFVDLLAQMPLHWAHVFVLFLLGVLAHRSGILRDPASHRPFLRKLAVCGFAFGLLFEAAFVFRPEPGSTTPWSYVMAWFFGFFFVASMGLGLSYAAALLLLLQRPRARKWLAPIGKVGRMALTNYLMQSAINSFVFYGFGLGQHDRLSPLQCLPIFLGIYAVEVAWSGPWLARFEYGPVEWLWRSLTYGKAQQMRVRTSLEGATG